MRPTFSPRVLRSARILGCLAAIGLAGCGPGTETSSPGKGSPGTGVKDSTPAEDLPELTGEVKLEVASWEEVQERIAAHKGKVVVLDIWSNYCDPCLKEFPGLVKLQRRFLGDVVCMSINTNYGGIPPEGPTDENKEEALETLNKNGAKFENFLSSTPDEILLDQKLQTTLPTVMVYDREGKLVKTFNNDRKEYGPEFSYAKHVEPFVKQLVGETKGAAAGR